MIYMLIKISINFINSLQFPSVFRGKAIFTKKITFERIYIENNIKGALRCCVTLGKIR